MGAKRTIEDGYDRLGERFGAWVERNPDGVRRWFLGEVLRRLSPGSDVLELGCGPGTAAQALAEGRRYTGVDLSEVQLGIARERVPAGTFIHADLTAMSFPAGRFDAVVAFYVFNHVPRAEVAPTFGRILRWLRPDGRLMLSLGVGDIDDEIQQDWLGVPMFFAGFDLETNERLLREAGFELELSQLETEIEEGEDEATFHWVIARKPGAAG